MNGNETTTAIDEIFNISLRSGRDILVHTVIVTKNDNLVLRKIRRLEGNIGIRTLRQNGDLKTIFCSEIF